MLALSIVAGVRASSELDPGNPLTWLLTAGFAAVLAAIIVLYVRMQGRQARAAEPVPQG
jgi:hypothetical protein